MLALRTSKDNGRHLSYFGHSHAFISQIRCLYLSRCYSSIKRYAEALALTQHGSLHFRSARTTLSLVPADTDLPITFFPLSPSEIEKAEQDLAAEVLDTKKAWFAHNGGVYSEPGTETGQKHKKPLFFDIALNYVQLDMDQLQERAGRKVDVPAKQAQKVDEKAEVKKAKMEEPARVETPEPDQVPAKGGLGSLLGGWWGRK